MNFRKLITYLTMGTAAAMPFAVAQNPTILQGNYITNVFGNSNFVLNPNAQTNIANVTVSSATVTRSTTTPLVATSEFNITTSTSTGYADWSTRTFDAGMKGQNCEARFSYRGFSVGSTTAQILQGANVVAQLTLTASTDPRIASINFPCGDLSSATTFRLQQATASLTGTNEIGGIYIGLATNMANVAQAEFVGSLTWATGTDSNQLTGTSYAAFGAFTAAPTVVGSITSPSNAPAFTIPSFKPGNYRVVLTGQCMSFSSTTTDTSASYRLTDGSTQFGTAFVVRNLNPTTGANIGSANPCGSFDFQYTGATTSKTFQVEGAVAVSGTTMRLERSSLTGFQITVYRFPSSSELVVTPERQNVFGGIRTLAASGSFSTASTTNTQITGLGNFTAVGSATSVGSMQFTMPTVPVGTYKLEFFVLSEALPSAANTRADCIYTIYDGSDIYTAAYLSSLREGSPTDTPVQGGVFGSTVVRYNSVQTNKQFTVQVRRAGSGGTCASYGAGVYSAYFTITPVDQPSNSALYVEGPVKAAATGAAIPEGYVNEFATRSIADASIREQLNPVLGTVYYPWTTTLSLPAGNWLVCYKVLGRLIQTESANKIGFFKTYVQNQTDSTFLMQNTNLGQYTATYNLLGYIWGNMTQCKPVAITATKTFRVGISAENNTGTPVVTSVGFDGNTSASELYAIRLN